MNATILYHQIEEFQEKLNVEGKTDYPVTPRRGDRPATRDELLELSEIIKLGYGHKGL